MDAAPPTPAADALEVAVHAGWRGDLWDSAVRIEGGVALRSGWFGVELQGCRRLPAEDRYEGQVAVALFSDTGEDQWVLRDDLGSVAVLATLVPGPLAQVGPDLAVGPELGWTAYRDVNFGAGTDVRYEPFPTVGVLVRGGVHANVGRVGLRLTVANRTNWLREVDLNLDRGPVVPVGEWRTALDAVVRLR